MTVTVAAVTGAAPGPAMPPRPLLAAVLATLPGAAGRAALLLPEAPRLRAGARRRMAEAILEEAAATGGGLLLRAAEGTLLLGTSPATARRAAGALGPLAQAEDAPAVWRLPQDAPRILAWATEASPAPAIARAAAPDPGGLPAALDALPPEAVLRAERLTDPAGAPRGRRLRLSHHAIAAALGPLAADPDLLAHAEDRLAARLLPGLGAWAAAGPGLRLVPVARRGPPPPTAAPGAVAVLPLAAAADPGFPALRERLTGRGWDIALAGLEAACLALLDPARLPAGLLLLRWSPALAAPDATAALRALGPGRLVLEGAGDPACLAAAQAAGALLARGA
ncbi:hypothetical protein [Roseicella aquatilis]|uniref:Uncharacterized protein n=1 Tax=Roseicella aquatilis TaxID=2527868 RepID=A0A4R4DS43_9PROT|nr:hypothetical protein [Roseicella aquatilis]TCZ64025.1 hypothetical protein EXY23_08635 [Roseicella aquatilis]